MQSSRQARQARNGFTLIELLLTIVIIAILAGIVIVAIRPKKNLADVKDAKRRQDLNAMIEALYQYQIDHNSFPILETQAALDQTHRDICTITSGVPVDLVVCKFILPQSLPIGPLVPDFLAALPNDPDHPGNPENCGDDFFKISVDCVTGYQLWLDETGRIHASAPLGNEKQGIELAR